eukprot:886490-Amorphochlora_amoeboformis.AAC.1
MPCPCAAITEGSLRVLALRFFFSELRTCSESEPRDGGREIWPGVWQNSGGVFESKQWKIWDYEFGVRSNPTARFG